MGARRVSLRYSEYTHLASNLMISPTYSERQKERERERERERVCVYVCSARARASDQLGIPRGRRHWSEKFNYC